MDSSTQTALLVLNWNNARDTLQCLQSLEPLQDAETRIIAIDNGSTDDSARVIADAYTRQSRPHIELLETHQNLGYAGGNNFGIRRALEQGAQYIGIVNNDVQVAPGFLAPLMNALSDPQVGVVTPLVAYMSEPDKVWALGQAVDWKTGNVTRVHAQETVQSVQQLAPSQVDAASGTAMLFKREVLERVGLLDDSFYLYYEETDWCLRVRQAGYTVLAVPASVVRHAVSSTLGAASPVIDYYMLRNHLRFIARHWTGLARLRIMAATVLEGLRVIAAYTAKPWGGQRRPHRNARLLALRDAALGRWGKMGPDVAAVCAAEYSREAAEYSREAREYSAAEYSREAREYSAADKRGT